MSASRILLCNCYKTMELEKAGQSLSDRLQAPVCTELCRGELSVFEDAVNSGEPMLVACTQEAPLFQEIAEEADAADLVHFTNIRETAGWTKKGTAATAKILALLEDAVLQEQSQPTPAKPIESDGLCLVYGAGQAALDAALQLEETLSVTLVLSSADDVVLPSVLPFPVFQGKLKTLTGSLGAFQVTLDNYAPMLPSSRARPEFLMPRDGARSTCSLVVDLSGETPPLTAPHRRDGYFRAEPSDPVRIAAVLHEASEMVGEFEKPLYVSYREDICAHSHAGKTGCSKCLDACPAGAITSTGENVAIDAGICGGCGSCAANCPTGAITYQYPYRADLLTRIQALLSTYGAAGGKSPVLLVHSADHGGAVINALARFGDGLPANVLPLSLHAVTALGHDAMVTAFTAGALRIVILCDPEHSDELAPLEAEADLTRALLEGMGHDSANRIEIVADSDPDALAAAVGDAAGARIVSEVHRFSPVGGKRDVVRMAISALHAASPDAPEIVPLPENAPYGRITVASDGCTLCLSCVSACPAGALSDNPDRPQVSFIETACVQCGLCQTTCPEKVITLEPRFNTAASAMQAVILHEEEPANCVSCGKPFGTRSTIERIKSKLGGQHHMFRSDEQIRLIEMCDDCRIDAQWNMDDSLLRSGSRPRIRTTEDYLNADKQGLSVDDFLKED
ncbi:4Fe-4S dicluster domain-containing protein [uncultured Roseibium sp.]|uniref:4Fe-4S dicluster domain-containing protein n=1 Tax=uncultured Roseibium sp. TaxID=1936171 RepID=UPI003217B4DF